ncbi:MAG TPA: family 16 glycoside hydrolase [Ktedonobacteraceae bacterium]
MSQNPNEYNPYAPPPSGPNYNPIPNSGYGTPPSGPHAGYGTPPNYADPIMPGTDPSANPYSSYNPGAGSAIPTSYGAYGEPTAPPPPPPYTMPGYMPPAYTPGPSIPPPRQPRRSRTLLIVVIVLLIIVAGSIFGGITYHNNQVTTQNNNNATATVQKALAESQAHATATAGSFATATTIASNFPFFAHLALNDPLTSNSNSQYGWQTDHFCTFSGNAYQALDDQKNTYGPCVGMLTKFTDFTFQVDVTMKQGDTQSAGGLYFRADGTKSQGYIFTVDQQKTYTIWIATDTTSNNSRTLKTGSAPTFVPGSGQSNTLAVAARGGQISLYVNQQLLITIQDSTYATGEIGFISSNTDATTIMSYNNVKVWTA